MRRLFLFAVLIFLTSMQIQIKPQEKDIIRAKIAILHKSGDSYAKMKSRDRIHAGDLMRIFVQPLNDCYVYVIHTDNEGTTNLYSNDKGSRLSHKDTLILPSKDEFYTFDNKSPTAKISIICSLNKLHEIDNLFSSGKNVKPAKWAALEKKMNSENKINISDKSDKPFPIAGNVSAVNEEFLKKQMILTGKNILIRKYEIEIKK